jgi:phosphohistidine phosphatase
MQAIKMSVVFNNIIVWRHAEAELANSQVDMARTLTMRGQRQAKCMARWLKQYLPKETMLLCSPAVRCVQTAEALNYKAVVDQALNPSAKLQEILGALDSLDSPQRNVLLVGHQPWLGQLVTHLTGFSSAELNIKKGAIWWLRQSLNQTYQYNVISVQTPSLLPK